MLKSFYPHPQVVLWLAGIGLAVKLWVIDRLCRYRSLALLCKRPMKSVLTLAV